MLIPRRNEIINPLAKQKLNDMKYEIAEELGYFNGNSGGNREKEYREALNRMKFEVAHELGIPLKDGYNGDLTTKEAGTIGGRLGGRIGGNMVKRMIEYAEEKLAEEARSKPEKRLN